MIAWRQVLWRFCMEDNVESHSERRRPRIEYMKQTKINMEKDSYKDLKELWYKIKAWRTTANQSNGLRRKEVEETITFDKQIWEKLQFFFYLYDIFYCSLNYFLIRFYQKSTYLMKLYAVHYSYSLQFTIKYSL